MRAGHKIEKRTRRIYFYGSNGGIEGGRIDHYLVCSCGEKWRHELVNPLTNQSKWQA